MIRRRADRNLSPCFLDRLGDTIRIQCVFRGSLKKSGLLRVFAYASKPKNARCPAFSILPAKNLRPQAEKFLLLSRRRKPQGWRLAMIGNVESGKKVPLVAHRTLIVSPMRKGGYKLCI